MRVLRTLTGSAAHLPARNAYDSPEPFPMCTPVGTAVAAGSGGITRFFPHTAEAATCKRCLAALGRAHAEAITEDALRTATAASRVDLAEVEAELETEARAMHAQHMMTFEGQAQEDALAARHAEPCGQCGSERSNPRHHSAEGHADVDRAAELVELLNLPARDTGTHGEDETSGMHVELASGLTEFVEPGDRLQHGDSGERGTVTAVGPNALDLRMDDGTCRSGASWYWGRPSLAELVADLPEVAPALVIDPSKYDSDAQLAEATAQVRALREAGPIDRQAVLPTRVESLLDSGTHTQKCRDNGEAARCDGSCSRSATARGEFNCPAGTACSGAPFPGHVAHEPIGEVAAPRQHIYTPNGEAALVLGSGTHGGRLGVWAVREDYDPGWGAFFVDEESLTLQFSAYRPGERARLADAGRVLSRLAEPGQVAELARSIAERAEAFASGTVPSWGHEAFRLRMESDAATLAAWLGMSTPVKLASYPSPYGGTGTVAEAWQARAGVQARLCRVASSRWTTYGATCNTPVREDGTCPEAQLHV